MDRTAAMRQIGNLAPFLAGELVAKLADASSIKSYAAGDTLFRQGDAGDSLHIVRTGSVTVSQRIAGRDMVLSYLPAGSYVGEMALLADTPRTATVKAAVRTETIQIEGEAFKAILAAEPQLRREMERLYNDRIMATERMANAPEASSIIEFLVRQGLGEATDVLLIDESLCVRCNNCEKACAETHGGVSRLNREAGPSFASIHIPTSCRHCEHPHCMTDCPPNAIHRNPNGEVFITDACIGCGNCERNCPYGVIQMAGPPEKRPGLLNWLLFGLGLGPGEAAPHHDDHHADDGSGAAKPKRKTAVKCDMCKDIAAGPSCVRACPTGAALRASPEEFMSLAALTKGR
jgi:Fe-S-cluster-containing hydrogenase component 2